MILGNREEKGPGKSKVGTGDVGCWGKTEAAVFGVVWSSHLKHSWIQSRVILVLVSWKSLLALSMPWNTWGRGMASGIEGGKGFLADVLEVEAREAVQELELCMGVIQVQSLISHGLPSTSKEGPHLE